MALIERQQALLFERQRLMQDMHDGVGSGLISSLAMVEKGDAQASHLADVLRDCVEELRLVIHSLEPVAHDLTTLLASLRERIGKRLEASGIRLVWQMDDIPTLAWLEAPQALQILRIVQESLANVMKHACATEVIMRAGLEDGIPEYVRVCIRDNGKGFDAVADSTGRGIRNIRARAEKLGGKISIEAAPGKGCALTLWLPLAGAEQGREALWMAPSST